MAEAPTWRVVAPVSKMAAQGRLRGHVGSLLGEWTVMLDPASAALAAARRFANREAWQLVGTVEPSGAMVRFIRDLAQRPEVAELLAGSTAPVVRALVEDRDGLLVVREQALPMLAGVAALTPIMAGTTVVGARIQNEARRMVGSGGSPRQSASDAGGQEPDDAVEGAAED